MRRGVRIPAWYLLLVAGLCILSKCESLRDLERFARRHHVVLTESLRADSKSVTADVGDGLALGNQLIGGSLLRRSRQLKLADDLLRCIHGAFHGRVPGPAWLDEDSHSPWIDCQGPRQQSRSPLSRQNAM